ncbi:MAG: Clp protease ClpP, partial [Clostridia bacterium]|nr:Clp protease ClpP [Clostridia bacterium]
DVFPTRNLSTLYLLILSSCLIRYYSYRVSGSTYLSVMMKALSWMAFLLILLRGVKYSVFAGVAIYNILMRHKGKRTVHVDGVAASIASVIAMCGDKIIMPSNSCLMIHCPLCLVVGNAKELRKMADDLDTIQGSIEAVYETKLAGDTTIDQIREMMDAETWLTATEAAKYFDVEVTEANAAAAKADYMLPKFKNMPENIKNNILQAAENEKNKEREKLMLELELLGI